jgi:hypothetical protein
MIYLKDSLIHKGTAILSLRPAADFEMYGDAIKWNDKLQDEPTSDEITAEVTRLQAEYDNNAYQRQRATAYPSIADQLDQIYHEGLDAWKATILAVKEEFPK